MTIFISILLVIIFIVAFWQMYEEGTFFSTLGAALFVTMIAAIFLFPEVDGSCAKP